MNNIRSLILRNSVGETYDLNDTNSFLQKISGLGAEHRRTYENIANNYVEIADFLRQKRISGDLFFPTYQKYKNFADFVQLKPLTLIYTTFETYYIDVNLDLIEKSEKETGGLYCKINLYGLGMFYKVITDRNDSDIAFGKKYSYSYPYTYTNNAASTLQFNVDSEKKCPCKLIILGPAINPSWTHYLNGVVETTGKVNVTLSSGQRLIVDTTSIPYKIIKSDNNGANAENVYQNSDFSTKRFILLGNGQNTVRISHEGADDLKLYLERRELYETV